MVLGWRLTHTSLQLARRFVALYESRLLSGHVIVNVVNCFVANEAAIIRNTARRTAHTASHGIQVSRRSWLESFL